MSIKIYTDKEKIIQYIESKGISKNKFYKETGFSNGFLDSGSSFSVENLRIILDKYRELNPSWLLTGKGEMLLKEPVEAPAVDHVPDAENAQAVELLEKEVATLKEALKEAYKENGRLEWQLEQAKKDIITLKKSGSGVGVSELKSK